MELLLLFAKRLHEELYHLFENRPHSTRDGRLCFEVIQSVVQESRPVLNQGGLSLPEKDLSVRIRLDAQPGVHISRTDALLFELDIIVDDDMRHHRLHLVRRKEASRADIDGCHKFYNNDMNTEIRARHACRDRKPRNPRML